MEFKVFYFAILFCSVFALVSCKVDCGYSHCYSLTPEQIVSSLWSLPTSMSSLVGEFKDTIISLIHTVEADQFSYLMVVSLWSIDRLMGFDPEVPQSYIYAKMINETIAIQDGKSDDDMKYCLDSFCTLCQGATDNSVNIGLRAAGCPFKKSTTKYPPISFSIKKNTIDRCIDSGADLIPERLRGVIKRLLSSKNTTERVLGLVAVASSIGQSSDFFSRVQEDATFLKTLQLKACNMKIPPECCEEREKILRTFAKKLNSITSRSIDDMKNNR